MGHGPRTKPYFIRTEKLEKSVAGYLLSHCTGDRPADRRSSVSLGWRCLGAAGREGIVSDSYSKQSQEKGSDRLIGE